MTYTSLVVQGETLTYTASGAGGGIIVNNWAQRAKNNLVEYANDLKYGNVHGYNMLVVSCVASGASAVNTFTIPVTPLSNQSTLQGVSYDGINVTNASGSGTITGVGILFPPNPDPGQLFILVFDTVVTTVTLVAETGYTINGAITAATANQVFRWTLIGSVWKPC
jgi:hypothetical protein